MDEADRVHKFINGLKSEVAKYVKLQRPRSLETAFAFALAADSTVWSLRNPHYYDNHFPRQSRQQTSNQEMSSTTPMEIGSLRHRPFNTRPKPNVKNKRPGVCYNCGKPGHYAVDCKEDRVDVDNIKKTARAGRQSN